MHRQQVVSLVLSLCFLLVVDATSYGGYYRYHRPSWLRRGLGHYDGSRHFGNIFRPGDTFGGSVGAPGGNFGSRVGAPGGNFEGSVGAKGGNFGGSVGAPESADVSGCNFGGGTIHPRTNRPSSSGRPRCNFGSTTSQINSGNTSNRAPADPTVNTEQITNLGRGICPPVRPCTVSSRTRPVTCTSSAQCVAGRKCCFDSCIQTEVCKVPV
ncbi:uncharacterized protein LOC121865066 [Homarus americanus]|uniref:WAP domain-containing protein n=1 Tax=Homarus americanus TaxID=6706 RepID=A0A8J5K588_HOMAM|nr:uncharacterized protein LOC121865066 [Homarus americanus]KAG7170130.1 hypothetical protein Hamer_G012371 [Homarus americanus]